MILDKGIPLPAAAKGKTSGKWKFLDTMEAGDSVLTTSPDEFDKARYAMIYYAKKNGWEYATRKEPNGTGWRIWRVS